MLFVSEDTSSAACIGANNTNEIKIVWAMGGVNNSYMKYHEICVAFQTFDRVIKKNEFS